MKKKVSIVTPVFNESENISEYYDRMNEITRKLEGKYEFEFIITDNNSTDNSFALFTEIAKRDSRFKLYKLARNFGYQKSIWTGYSKATGDVGIEFDCDLQDPPELLPAFLSLWEQGNKIVYGVRKSRKEGFFITLLRKIFYRVLSKISDTNIPVDAGDFMMIDRVIMDQLKNIKNHSIYLRGIIFSFGYTRDFISYSRSARKGGKSKFPFLKLVALGLDGIVSESILPLRLATIFGIFMSLSSALFGIFYFLNKLFFTNNLPRGFTTLVILILFSVGLNSIFLGIIGEYLARIYLQVKKMPITLIEEEIVPKSISSVDGVEVSKAI